MNSYTKVSKDFNAVTRVNPSNGKLTWTKGVYGKNNDIVKPMQTVLLDIIGINTNADGEVNEPAVKMSWKGWAAENMPTWKSTGTYMAKYSIAMKCFRDHGLLTKVTFH